MSMKNIVAAAKFGWKIKQSALIKAGSLDNSYSYKSYKSLKLSHDNSGD